MSDRDIQLLKDLIAINSVNPSLVPGGAGEGEIAQRLATEMRSFGLDVTVSDAAPGRPNVIGIVEGRATGKTLMLCGHSDTVGVDGMDAPFDPLERDGKVFGRGAQDMKGGVAAMVGAARRIAEGPVPAAGRLIVAIVADEEYASIGAEAMVKEWRGDAAVVTEPTDLTIGVGHKGFEWVEVETHGVAAHGSRPAEGVDAILMMGRVLAGLERLERRLINNAPHPLLGRGSVHASLVTGGRELSTYPDRCRLSIERRTIAGEPEGISLLEIEEILDELRLDRRFEAQSKLLFTRKPYVTPEGHLLPRLIAQAASPRLLPIGAMSFWTDAAVIGHAGTPSVVFGPGGAGLHGLEEFVRVEEVLTCRDILTEVVTTFCR